MESEQLEDALSILDKYRDGGSEDDYAEVVDLCTEVKDIVEQLEHENNFNRQTLVKYLSPDTMAFFQSLFSAPSDEYTYQLERRLHESESEVKELLEKRNTLEMERIQLLDKIAELQISIARVHQGTNSETRSESGATLRRLPLQTSSPHYSNKPPTGSKALLLSPDEGIEDSRPSSRSSSSCSFSPQRTLPTSRLLQPNGTEPKGPKALSTPNLNDFETNSATSTSSSFERSKNQKSFRKFISLMRLGSGDMKSPKITRPHLPTCGAPTGIELNGGIRTWGQSQTVAWMKQQAKGLGDYTDNIQNGESLLFDFEKTLGMSNQFHQKKLRLALRALDNKEPGSDLDVMWVCSWLDDIGLPEYKKSFHENLIDGRTLNLLTIDELMTLGVTSQLHYLSIKRGIEVLRMNGFNRGTMISRPVYDGRPEPVERWSLFRMMEWLRSIELAEFATNLRGTGVHGGLIALEPAFCDEHFATLLQMPVKKTLLRQHLQMKFQTLLDDEQIESKKEHLIRNGMPMPLTARLKRRKKTSSFSLVRSRSSSNRDDELVCPLNLGKRRLSISPSTKLTKVWSDFGRLNTRYALPSP